MAKTTQMAPPPQTLHQWAPALPLPFSIAAEPCTPVCLLSLCPFVLLSSWFTSQHHSSLLSATLMQSSTEGGWLEKLVHIFSSHRASENTQRKREYRILERERERKCTREWREWETAGWEAGGKMMDSALNPENMPLASTAIRTWLESGKCLWLEGMEDETVPPSHIPGPTHPSLDNFLSDDSHFL